MERSSYIWWMCYSAWIRTPPLKCTSSHPACGKNTSPRSPYPRISITSVNNAVFCLLTRTELCLRFVQQAFTHQLFFTHKALASRTLAPDILPPALSVNAVNRCPVTLSLSARGEAATVKISRCAPVSQPDVEFDTHHTGFLLSIKIRSDKSLMYV
jgi:hypothetical protein